MLSCGHCGYRGPGPHTAEECRQVLSARRHYTVEECFDGGLYDEAEEYRTDVSVEIATGEDGRERVVLHVVTGNADISLVDISPARLADLGRWLVQVATK